MKEANKFAFDVGITFFASVANMLIGFVIMVLLGRYLGAGDLGLYRMTSTIYGIAMLIAAIGIPAAMIKCVAEFKDDKRKLVVPQFRRKVYIPPIPIGNVKGLAKWEK